MLQGVFGKIAGRMRERQQARIDSYRSLVTAVDGGGKIDPDKAAEILEAASKTPSDLAEDVQLLADRRLWRSQLEQEPKLLEENNALNAKLDPMRLRHNEERIALQKRQREENAALNDRLVQIASERSSAASARNKLLETDDRYGVLIELTSAGGKLVRDTQENLPYSLDRRKRHGEAIVQNLRRQIAEMMGRGFDPAWQLTGASPVPQRVKDLQRELANAEGEVAYVTQEINKRLTEAGRIRDEAESLEVEILAS